MSVSELAEPVVVKRAVELGVLAQALSKEGTIAVDTESNSLYAYKEQVCLIQFSTPHQDFLVDPLALDDMSPLGPVFANPNIEKVFHAAEYDLLCLKRDFDFQCSNLFDTMIAARTLGREEVGLGALLEAEFKVRLDKRFQRADWGERPLPRELLAYARMDTHYLVALRDRLRGELEKRGLLALAEEDFNRMTHVNGRALDARSPDPWRVSGAYDLNPQQAAVLRELVHYRDQAARSANRPLFKVLNDTTLLEIAFRMPRSLRQLDGIAGMTQGQIYRHGQRLLEAVTRGSKAEPVFPPRSPRPNEQVLERLDLLKRWRKEVGLQMGVKSDVILPRDVLQALAETNPRSPEELADLMKEVPWRLERFGGQILKILNR
jgi:ribonuclease D